MNALTRESALRTPGCGGAAFGLERNPLSPRRHPADAAPRRPAYDPIAASVGSLLALVAIPETGRAALDA